MINLEKSVKNKILLIVCSVFVLAMAVLIPVSRSTILTSLEKLEEELFLNDYFKTLDSAKKDISGLETMVGNWAKSGNACLFHFSEQKDLSYSQLTMKALSNVKMDFMLIFDDKGNVAKVIFPNAKLENMRDSLIKSVIGELELAGTSAKSGSGFMKFDGSVVMMTSLPVTVSGINNSIAGNIVAGRLIDSRLLAWESKRLGVNLSIVPPFPGEKGVAAKEGKKHRTAKEYVGEGPLVVQEKEQIGYIPLRNMGGGDIAAIRISKPRTIYLHCRKTVKDFMFFSVIIAIMQMVIIFIVLDDLIIARISDIKESLKSIGRNVCLQGRIKIEGNDEISSLSRSINEMIDTLARVMENIPDPIIISGGDGNIILMNETGRDITGYGSWAIAGLTVGKLTHSFYADDSYKDFWDDLVERGSLTFEAGVVKKDGTDYPVEFHSTLFSLGERCFALSVLRDITERKMYELELSKKAFRDQLTGLANRYLFYDRLNMAFEKYRRNSDYSFALMIIDLDRFKEVNDTLGHLAGDTFISEFASRLMSVTRLEDTLARWGGDEFVFLVQNISSKEQIAALLGRLESITTTPVSVDGAVYSFSFSVGIAIKDPNTENPDDLLFNADQALYEAKNKKKKGMSVVLFSPDLNSGEDPAG